MRVVPRAPLRLPLAALALLALAASAAPAEEEGGSAGAPTVSEGKTVDIEYTLTLADGTEADSNVGGEPLTFEQGKHQILPALEAELEGLTVDDRVTVTLPPEKGYGERNPELLMPVPKENVPEEAHEKGTGLMMQGPKGQRHQAVVHEVKEEELVLDLNHPLAGKTLTFDVKVLDIR